MVKEYSWEVVENFIKELSEDTVFDNPNYSLYIYIRGFNTGSFYRSLRLYLKIEVIWSGHTLPWWLFFLRFTPNKAGLLRIKNTKDLWHAFAKVWDLAFVTIFYINKDREKAILNTLKKPIIVSNRTLNIDDYIYEDPLYITIDVDSNHEKPLMEYLCASTETQMQIYYILNNVIKGKTKIQTE